MIAKIRPFFFYGFITLLTAIYWFSVREFARLPDGVHQKFFSAMFLPYLLVVALVANWYELQRRKAKDRALSEKHTNARSEVPKE